MGMADMHLFRGIVHTKSGEKLQQKGLSYVHSYERTTSAEAS